MLHTYIELVMNLIMNKLCRKSTEFSKVQLHKICVTSNIIRQRNVFSIYSSIYVLVLIIIAYESSKYKLHWTTNFKKIFVCVCVMNILLIYLFASMKLEEGHKKIRGSSFKIMLPLLYEGCSESNAPHFFSHSTIEIGM